MLIDLTVEATRLSQNLVCLHAVAHCTRFSTAAFPLDTYPTPGIIAHQVDLVSGCHLTYYLNRIEPMIRYDLTTIAST